MIINGVTPHGLSTTRYSVHISLRALPGDAVLHLDELFFMVMVGALYGWAVRTWLVLQKTGMTRQEVVSNRSNLLTKKPRQRRKVGADWLYSDHRFNDLRQREDLNACDATFVFRQSLFNPLPRGRIAWNIM
jgi:hypothetical protein